MPAPVLSDSTTPHHWAWGIFWPTQPPVPTHCGDKKNRRTNATYKWSSPSPVINGSWWMNTQVLAHREDASEAHTTTLLPRAPQQHAAPGVHGDHWLLNTHWPVPSLLVSLPPPLPMFPGTTSQINHSHCCKRSGLTNPNKSMSLSMYAKPTHVSP